MISNTACITLSYPWKVIKLFTKGSYFPTSFHHLRSVGAVTKINLTIFFKNWKHNSLHNNLTQHPSTKIIIKDYAKYIKQHNTLFLRHYKIYLAQDRTEFDSCINLNYANKQKDWFLYFPKLFIWDKRDFYGLFINLTLPSLVVCMELILSFLCTLLRVTWPQSSMGTSCVIITFQRKVYLRLI